MCNRHGQSPHTVLEMWGDQYHITIQHPVHTVKCTDGTLCIHYHSFFYFFYSKWQNWQ